MDRQITRTRSYSFGKRLTRTSLRNMFILYASQLFPLNIVGQIPLFLFLVLYAACIILLVYSL